MLQSSETHFNLSKKHDQCILFSWPTFFMPGGYLHTTRSACLCSYFERNQYLRRVIKGQKKIKIRSYESREKSYPDIKPIHIMLTESLPSITGVNNH